MKHHLWFINVILLLLLIIGLGFVILSRPKVPLRTNLRPDTELKGPKKIIQKRDWSYIYTKDLFGTYKEPDKPTPQPDLTTPLPKPPTPQPIKVPLPDLPKFLDPLQITLRGIIVVSNESENIAIIEDNKTKASKNYNAGDKISDSQIVRIMKNKIIIIRSNGQQETIYVNKWDAEIEQMILQRADWNTIVQKDVDPNSYKVDPSAFAKQVQNLAKLIDLFNLTTVYQKGESIGVRVGKLDQKSLVIALGIQSEDIIEKINGTPATDTQNRFSIYQQIIKMKPGDSIKVNLLRGAEKLVNTYKLRYLEDAPKTADQSREPAKQPEKTQAQMREEKIKLLREREKFAPTINELRKEEKSNIIRKSRTNQNILSNNSTK